MSIPAKTKKPAEANSTSISERGFRPAKKVTIQKVEISEPFLETLEKMIMGPLEETAKKEAKSKSKQKPATKALEAIKDYTPTQRKKFIAESSLRIYAGLELQRQALIVIAKGAAGTRKGKV